MSGFNGAGSWSRSSSWVTDYNNGLPISPVSQDAEWANVTSGFNTAFCRDGQALPTANWNMGGFGLTNVANATARTGYAALGQVQDSTVMWGGTAGGTANALSFNLTPALTAYAAGQVFRFIVGTTNTAAATLAVNGLTATAIKKPDLTALGGGELVAGITVTVCFDGTQFVLTSPTIPAVNASVRGLSGANNATTPNTKYDLSANSVILLNSTNSSARVGSTGTITNDTGLAGPAANGRDQAGAFSNSSWIYLYFIWNGTTVATLSSATGPGSFNGSTLPSGYTHWAFATVVRKNASGNIIPTHVLGSKVYYDNQTGSNQPFLVSGGTATTETSFTLTGAMPSETMSYGVNLLGSNTAAANSVFEYRVYTGLSWYRPIVNYASAATGFSAQFEAPYVGTSAFYLIANAGSVSYACVWYKLPNGDS